jgi:hypothetical protein
MGLGAFLAAIITMFSCTAAVAAWLITSRGTNGRNLSVPILQPLVARGLKP